MPENGIRSTYSQCPFQILVHDQDQGILSGATGFLYLTSSDETFLITSRHNVTGLDNFVGKYLPPVSHSRKPKFLTLKICNYVPIIDGEGKRKFGYLPQNIPLYSEVDGAPLWREHPALDGTCDVIAIPYEKPTSVPEFMHNHANMISRHRIPIRPGNTVFIIGFPQNVSTGIGLPIWKSGYLASEPAYDIDIGGDLQVFGGLAGAMPYPAMFIDSQTRPGMSGSPVFCQFTGTWNLNDPYGEVDQSSTEFFRRDDIAWNATLMEFIGIYGGRAPGNAGDAVLGICWKRQIIEDICTNLEPAPHPHA